MGSEDSWAAWMACLVRAAKGRANRLAHHSRIFAAQQTAPIHLAGMNRLAYSSRRLEPTMQPLPESSTRPVLQEFPSPILSY